MYCAKSQAERLAARHDFVWHQRFDLGHRVFTPGANDIAWLLRMGGVPEDFSGKSVLDVSTTNGGAAFIAERRGAQRVVAVDIRDENWYGFQAIKETLGSNVEFKQASIYELPQVLSEQFDIVLFLGVLYHLRHPLLALDNVRLLTRGTAWIETAAANGQLGKSAGQSVACFYRLDGYKSDAANWFVPSTSCLFDWCHSSGLEPRHVVTWPPDAPERIVIEARPVEPEFLKCSYESPVSAVVNWDR